MGTLCSSDLILIGTLAFPSRTALEDLGECRIVEKQVGGPARTPPNAAAYFSCLPASAFFKDVGPFVATSKFKLFGSKLNLYVYNYLNKQP